MDKLTPYLKTVFGFLTPGAVILGSAVTEASDGGSNVTGAEWVTALVACVVTGSLVFGVPNKDPRGTHEAAASGGRPINIYGITEPDRVARAVVRHEDGHRGEGGESAVAIALIVLVVVVILVLLVPALGR